MKLLDWLWSVAWIKSVSQPVSEQVATKNSDEDGKAGKQSKPGCELHKSYGITEHIAPSGQRRLCAKPKEREVGFRNDGRGKQK